MANKNSILIRLLAIAAGLAVALLSVELLVRVLHLDMARLPTWNDRPASYYIHEGSTSMRDTAYSKVKPADTFRIAVVGDSFAFAPYLQFDDTFSKKLERMLNLNLHQGRVEVINYGVPRYSTTHEVALAERALREQADLLILQITLNDPEIKPYRPTGLLAEEVNRFGQVELNTGIYRYWHTAAFVMRRIYNADSARRYVRYFFDLFENDDTWNSFSGAVGKIQKLAALSKVPLVTVTFPLFGVACDAHYPFRPLHQKVSELMQKINIPNLDLYDAYLNIPVERLQVLPGRDFHPNEIGHRIAGEWIYRWISSLQLVPQEAQIRRLYDSRIDIRIAGIDPASGESLKENP